MNELNQMRRRISRAQATREIAERSVKIQLQLQGEPAHLTIGLLQRNLKSQGLDQLLPLKINVNRVLQPKRPLPTSESTARLTFKLTIQSESKSRL